MHKRIALHIDRNYQRQMHIARHLKPLGFELHRASTVPAATEMAGKHRYGLVLMHFDAMGKEIFTFCSSIRAGSPHAVLIALMTHIRTSVEEKLFDCGVNDVVIGEQTTARLLTKRIQAHLHNSKSSCNQTNTITLKDTMVDFKRSEVWCNGTIRRLPGILADLLKYFVNNPNRTISREELYKSSIWDDSICSSPKEGGKTFDVNVSKLRKIIEIEPDKPRIIRSVRGVGWKLAIDVAG